MNGSKQSLYSALSAHSCVLQEHGYIAGSIFYKLVKRHLSTRFHTREKHTELYSRADTLLRQNQLEEV